MANTSLESQVAAAYKAAVGLDIPASNLAARVAEIQSGASSVAAYTNAINSSTKAQVSQAYQQATGSVPSQAALDSAVSQVKSGATTIGNLASQAQAQAQSKASTERDVAAAYKEATGTDIPVDKLAQRVADITSGVTTLDAYKTALNSSTRAQIAQAYKAAVGADMPAEKLEQRVAEINSGKTTLDEYKASVSASPRSQISKAYYSLTGELPSDALLESYVKQVKDGVQTVSDIQKYFGLIGTVAVTYKQAIGSDMPAEKLIQRVEDIQNGLTTLGDYKSALEASTRALVAKAYKSAIGLDIPAEKLEQRVSEIKSGKTTLDSYVANLNSSPRAIISKEYQAATGYVPTSELLESYVAKVNSGSPLETIKTEISNTPEAKDRAYNLTAKDNIPKFYTKFDESSAPVLDSNVIANNYHEYVNDVYQRLLGRPISDSEFAAFDRDKWFYTKTDDQAGPLSNAVLIEKSVLSSDEFKNRKANTSIWITDKTGQPVLIPNDIVSLPGVVSKVSRAEDPQSIIDLAEKDPKAWIRSLMENGAYLSGWISKIGQGELYVQSAAAGYGDTNEFIKDLQANANDAAKWLFNNKEMTADEITNLWDTTTKTAADTAQRNVLDQIHNDDGNWLTNFGDEFGDFLEKYQVTIMLAIAAPVMGAGLAAVAAGGVAAAGATAAVGSAAAAAEAAGIAAGLSGAALADAVAAAGFGAMSGTTLASAITASIMGVANTGMALGNGASWEQALKTGVFSSAASFTGAQLGKQIGSALTDRLVSEGMTKAAATQVAGTVSNTLSTSLSSGVAAAINGKDISDAMLISGIGAAIGSSLAGATGSSQIGNIAGGTAAGVVAGKDFGTAMQDSIISGAISLINGLVRDGATGTYENLKNTFSTYLGASDKAADWLATGTEKYNASNNGNWTLTDRIAEAMNPGFNPEEYRKINGIGNTVDAGTDYLTRGMEAGVPINLKEAEPFIAQAQTDFTNKYIKSMGYNSVTDVPTEVLASINSAVKEKYGVNLGAMQDAMSTPEKFNLAFGSLTKPEISAEYLKRIEDNVAKGGNTLAKRLEDQTWVPGWYTPSSSVFKMPTGLKYATEVDVAKAMAGDAGADTGVKVYSAIDSKGMTVYLVKDESYVAPKVYDKTTGAMTQSDSAALGGTTTTGSATTYNMFDGIKNMDSASKLNFFANANSEALQEIAKSYPTVGTSTVDPKKNEWLIKTIKDGVTQIRNAATQEDANIIYSLMDKGLDALGTTLEGIAQITGGATFVSGLLSGENPNNLQTMYVTKTLNGIVDAVRSDDMKASIRSYTDIIDKTPGKDVVGALLENVAENPAGALNFIGASLVSSLPGFALGRYAGVAAGAAAELEGFSSSVVNKITGGVAVGTSRAYEIGLEGATNGLDSFNTFYDAYKKANPSWTDAQISDSAMSSAKLVAGSAMVVTLGTQVMGLDKLTQNLLGTNNPANTTFQNVLNKLIATPLAEGIQEGPYQSGVPTIVQEMILKEIDPSRTLDTAIGQILGQSTLGTIAGLGSAAAIGMLQLPSDLVGTAVSTNPTFQVAVRNSGYTVDGLAATINSWLPPSLPGTSDVMGDIRSSAASQVLISNPNFADSYSNPQDYIDAVKDELGVWQPVVLADVAASVPKFSNQVITSEIGLKLLKDNGIENPTAQDVINSGLLGVADEGKNTALSNYISTVTGKPPVAPIVPIIPAKPTTPVTPTTPKEIDYNAAESQLADLIAEKEFSGINRDQAIQKSIDELAGKLGTTRTDLLSKLDITSQQFQNDIQIAKTDLDKQVAIYGQVNALKTQIKDQITAYENLGIDRETAFGLISQGLNTTKSDLLTKLGVSESELLGGITKPAYQVTTNDITQVKNMIANQTATNLAYDVNQDGKVDTQDLTLLQQQQQIQQNQNVAVTTDPNTGKQIYTDKTTGNVITGFTPPEGSEWGPNGISEVPEEKTSEELDAEKEKTAKQKNQFNNLMGMLFQAPDAAMQQVTVKTPDPARINYIYDFSSIFATPSQAQLMPSPYGALNTAPQGIGGLQTNMGGQAANHGTYGEPYKMAIGGFAEGGIVGDIQVGGGGSVEGLMNILKGNG